MEIMILIMLTGFAVVAVLAFDGLRTMIWRYRGTGPRRRRNSDE